MNRKITLDMVVTISAVTGAVLSYRYLQEPLERQAGTAVMAAVAVLYGILAVADGRRARQPQWQEAAGRGISELVLLGEDGNVTDTWDIYGKTSIVFGRDGGEFQADVNLKNTDYAGTVDGEHAVMNYSGGSWYIEDLDSENGTRIQRGGEGKMYKVSSREPCRLEKGDIIYLGLAPVKLR